jgi:hypothetical protein
MGTLAQGKFLSFEKVVAFVLGPVVAAGAGWLSTWLATELGLQLSSETITGIYGLGQLTAFGLAYKWLHGKQIEMKVGSAIANTQPLLSSMGVTPGIESGFIHTTLADLEGLAQHAAAGAVAAIHQGQAAAATPAQTQPPPAAPTAPVAGQAAGAGAAPVQ